MTPKVKPLSDRVLVLPAKAADKSPGGILLPDVAKQKPQRGEVLAVGPGRLDDKGARLAMSVKPGDVVIFSPWAGTGELKELEGAVLIREDEILAIVEK